MPNKLSWLLLFLLSFYGGYAQNNVDQPIDRSFSNPLFRDTVRQVRFNEVNFIIDQIENTYISGRRGLTNEEWDRRVELVHKKLGDHFFKTKDYLFTWRYIGLLKQDAHFPFPDRGLLNREEAFSKTDTIFPLWVQTWTDGTMYNVKDYTGVIPEHARILSVNGNDAQTMALMNRAMSPGEDANAMAMMNVQYEADPLYWPNFSNYLFTEGIHYPFEVIYTAQGKGVPDTVLLSGISREAKYKLFKKSGDKRNIKAERGSKRKPVVYTNVGNGIGVLTINTFWGKRWASMLLFGKDWRYKRLIRKAMRKIDRQDVRNLVIDISTNPGGMTENIYYTLNYLTDKSIDIRQIYHVTDNNRERIKTNLSTSIELPKSDREYLVAYIDSLKEGTVFCTDTVCQLRYKPDEVKHRYQGNIYVLTGYQTYSAAQMFARYCQTFGLGQVAGQHCGGYNDITGNSAQIRLPSLGWMRFEVPYCADRICAEDDPYDYPTVDILIELNFNEWLHREDRSLDKLIEIIKNN